MEPRLAFFVLFLLLGSSSCSWAHNIKLTVKTVTSIAETDDDFVCATLDWWPGSKCNYNRCTWAKNGIMDLDLSNKILVNAIKAFSPLRIRVGGSLQDQIIYKVGTSRESSKCPHFKLKDDGLFGYSKGCLHMDKWDELNAFFNQTRAKITFGLNALIGREYSPEDKTLAIGDWDYQNAHDLMNYTMNKGYAIDSYEFGNELCGSGVSMRVSAEQYAKDMIVLQNIVQEVYPDPSTRPKVLGPGGFYDQQWFNTFLQNVGPNVIDGVTHHIYNLGAGVDPTLINKVQDPYFLDKIAQTYEDIVNSVNLFGPSSAIWVGESGGAYNSGGFNVSNTFVDGFWYLDQLGMTSTFNHKVFCRQALVGGHYSLLNRTSFVPNPDYYGALLWHRLMGETVLAVSHKGSPYLRAYAHCSKNSDGVSILLINMLNSTSFKVSVADDLNLYPPGDSMKTATDNSDDTRREEYHLTPDDGNIQSEAVLLNGIPLKLNESDDIPEMNPVLVDAELPIKVAHDSVVFVTLKGFKAPACS